MVRGKKIHKRNCKAPREEHFYNLLYSKEEGYPGRSKKLAKKAERAIICEIQRHENNNNNNNTLILHLNHN